MNSDAAARASTDVIVERFQPLKMRAPLKTPRHSLEAHQSGLVCPLLGRFAVRGLLASHRTEAVNFPCLKGGQTPSTNSLYQARSGQW